ncbi:MAG: EndoU domain-containing protein [Acidobacteria bacterium]|jgi:hypothetical protein|nr:EndoU domain-containing protein [Acidobacteriota bacterium]
MKRRTIFSLALILLPGMFLAGTGGILPGTERAIDHRTRVWSDTRPAVNLTHVFAGEINRRGRLVGFHSRPGGVDPRGSGIARIVDPPNRFGVYTAMVWIGRRSRTKFSTFYPDCLTRAQVIGVILDAYRRGQRRGERFRGPSGHGFTVEGYAQNGRIHTAYPIYSR